MNSTIGKTIEIEEQAKEFGFYWDHYSRIVNDLIDETREIKKAVEQNHSREHLQEEIGDALFASFSLCIFFGFNPEETIAKAKVKIDKNTNILEQEQQLKLYDDIVNNLIGETKEIKRLIEQNLVQDNLQEEIGNTLVITISLCDFFDFDFEETLDKANIKIGRRIDSVISNAKKAGFDSLKGESIETKMQFWRQAKLEEVSY